MTNQPLDIWTGEVIDEWVDYNGHMSEAFYGVVFAMASDEYLLRMGFDEGYRAETGGAFYTVETHICFLEELAPHAPLVVRTTVVGADELRVHLFHELLGGPERVIAATQESLLLHVDTTAGQVSPMGGAVHAVVSSDAASHVGLVQPDQLGRTIKGPSR